MALIHFIVNPLRPSVGLNWPYEEKKIEALTKDFEVHITRGRLHAEILTRQAVESGAKLIVCVGGDSTLGEIANGLYRVSETGREIPHLALHGALQVGDAIKSLDIQKNFREFLSNYFSGSVDETRLDLGEVEFTGDYGQRIRRVFVNSAGFGFSASLVTRLRSSAYQPSRFKLLRIMASLIPFYRFTDMNILINDQILMEGEDPLCGLVHNGRYAANGFDLSPDSSMSDAQMEYTLVKRTFTTKYLLGIFPLFAGRLSSSSIVQQGQCKEMKVETLETNRKVKVDFDGDTWGFLPAKFRILPSALPILR